MTEDPKLKTISYYDRNAENWVHQHPDRSTFWHSEIKKFHELLPQGRILEIGSGSGDDAKALIALGYDYVGTDASSGFLKFAREKNPNANFVHKSIDDLDSSLGEFDGFWCAATLLHVPKNKIDSALKAISSRIKDGGIGFITLKRGEGEETEERTGRFFAYYQLDEFGKILKRNGFEVIEDSIEESKPFSWLKFFVRKR